MLCLFYRWHASMRVARLATTYHSLIIIFSSLAHFVLMCFAMLPVTILCFETVCYTLLQCFPAVWWVRLRCAMGCFVVWHPYGLLSFVILGCVLLCITASLRFAFQGPFPRESTFLCLICFSLQCFAVSVDLLGIVILRCAAPNMFQLLLLHNSVLLGQQRCAECPFIQSTTSTHMSSRKK